MTIKVRAKLGIGFPGAEHVEVLEFDDDATQADIDEAVRDWAMGYVDYHGRVIEGTPAPEQDE